MNKALVWGHMWDGEVSPKLLDSLKTRLMTTPPESPRHLCELLSILLYHTDRDHPALRQGDMLPFGQALVDLTTPILIDKFTVYGLEPAPPEIDARIRKLVILFSERCTFAKTGDAFIRNIIRTRLTPDRHAVHSASDVFTPFAEQIPGQASNRILRPFIDTHPTKISAALDWKSTDGLLFAAAMLSELLESRCQVMINHELLHTDKPTLFVISGIDLGFGDAFGCRVGDDLMVTSNVTAAIWHWAANSDNDDLVTALSAPETLQATSKFHGFQLGAAHENGRQD